MIISRIAPCDNAEFKDVRTNTEDTEYGLTHYKLISEEKMIALAEEQD